MTMDNVKDPVVEEEAIVLMDIRLIIGLFDLIPEKDSKNP